MLADSSVLAACTPIMFGDAQVLANVACRCRLGLPSRVIPADRWPAVCDAVDGPATVDLGAIECESVEPGRVTAKTGAASYRYIEASIAAALASQVDAVVTGPVHKEALHAAGVPFPGQTEIFTAKTRASRSCMMLTSSELTCSFVTGHVGLSEVPRLLSVARILDVIQLSHEAVSRLRGREAKLTVCGLNPHAGEHGLFGRGEEERLIAPAVEAARQQGIHVEGPLPPDTAFLPRRRRETDCFVCMYHDQGLVLLKALAFDSAVNVTLGLPIIRTSVDHGTALDIAWQGKADAGSLIHAVKLAITLASSRTAAAT
jgi:4-hydroxythreonine-4-phosphate dehydrogenase